MEAPKKRKRSDLHQKIKKHKERVASNATRFKPSDVLISQKKKPKVSKDLARQVIDHVETPAELLTMLAACPKLSKEFFQRKASTLRTYLKRCIVDAAIATEVQVACAGAFAKVAEDYNKTKDDEKTRHMDLLCMAEVLRKKKIPMPINQTRRFLVQQYIPINIIMAGRVKLTDGTVLRPQTNPLAGYRLYDPLPGPRGHSVVHSDMSDINNLFDTVFASLHLPEELVHVIFFYALNYLKTGLI
jgi:hypothetical protein